MPLQFFLFFLALLVALLLVTLNMRVRRFYLVRHGQTLLNATHTRQGEDGALSPKGREQAERVGRALEQTHISRIISSTYPRATETAVIIATHLKASIVYSSLFVERRNPSEIIGKSTHDPDVIRIVDQMDLAYHDDDYRFSDEENFVDMRNRARQCLDFLARQSATKTAVVTHHVLLKMLIAYLLYRDRLHASDFAKLAFFNTSDNAGITVCEYHPWKMFSPTHGWEVVVFNEQPMK